MNRKIVIIGTSCMGKSTLAKNISKKLDIPHFELDNYYWEKNWTAKPIDEFVNSVENLISKDKWVICGNYSKVRSMIWDASTEIMWLDYSFFTVMYRALKRSILRSITKQEVCNGNKESLKKTFFTKSSILLWVLQTYKRRKIEYPVMLKNQTGKRIHHFKNQHETDKFLLKL